jgi:hypothetical protein
MSGLLVEMGVLLTFCLGWSQTVISLISASEQFRQASSDPSNAVLFLLINELACF